MAPKKEGAEGAGGAVGSGVWGTTGVCTVAW